MFDLRYALRTLRRAPAFTALATLTLALGIGANTAIFAVIDAVLLRPLPYPEAEQVVAVLNHWDGNPAAALSPAEYFDYRDQTDGLVVSAFVRNAVVVTGGSQPERVAAGLATASIFGVLGVQPAIGRAFTTEEDAAGGAPVAVLTDGYWRRRFGADPGVIGRTLQVNGEAVTILGVMPADFRVPDDFAAADPVGILMPLGLDPAEATERGSHFLQGYARLEPGISLAAADAAIAAVAARFVLEYPDDYPIDSAFGVSLVPLRDVVTGPVRPGLLVLLGSVGLVLLIACANVAALVLSRADTRKRELAVRAALGAPRSRLMRQLFLETSVLAAAGGAAGVLIASWAAGALVRIAPPEIPRLDSVALDTRVLVFALAATAGTAFLFGLAPALHASRADPYRSLRDGGRGSTGGRAAGRFRGVLVIAEIALALLLLTGAGLLGRSFVALTEVDPGYDTTNLLTFRISLPAASYPEDVHVTDAIESLRMRLAALPGATAAGAVTNLPLTGSLGDLNFYPADRVIDESDVSPAADWQTVTPGYFDAIGMRVLRGRGIAPRDRAGAPGVVVINQSLAGRYWPDTDALGQRFTLGGGAGPGEVTVVGIVEDIRHASLAGEPRPEMYLAHAQFRFWSSGAVVRSMTFVVRSTGAAASLAAGAREALRSLDPNLPMSQLRTMEEVRTASVARPRFLALLLSTFAAAAVALAAIGVYGVMAYNVARRTQEVGIRVALGARPADVIRLVVRDGMLLAGSGIAIGLAGAVALSRLLTALLFGTTPHDPITLVAVVVITALVALAACWLPARRAARLDPIVALGNE